MKMPRLLQCSGLVLLCGLLGAAGGCSKPARSMSFVSRADAYAKAARFDEAEIEYLNALRLDGQNEKAIHGLGTIFLQQGRIGTALPYLLKARSMDANDVALRLELARLNLATGNFAGAYAEAEYLLDKNPKDPWAPILLAESIIGESDGIKLKERLQKLAETGNTAALQVGIGLLEYRLRNDAAAETALNNGLKLDPGSFHARLGLAVLAQKQNQLEKAEQYLKEAAQLAPRRTQESLTYAKFKLNAKDNAAARKILNQLYKESPDYLPIWVMQAEIAGAEKQYKECAVLIGKILAKDPNQPGVLLMSGRLNLATGDQKKALAIFERMAKMFPRAAWVQQQLALAYVAGEDKWKAEQALNQAIALDPSFPEPVYLLAMMLAEKKDFDSTIVALQRLLEKRPGLPRARAMLAEAFREKGNPADAIKLYRELEQVDTKDAKTPWYLGLAYLQQKNWSEARAAFSRVLAIMPDNILAVEQLVNLDLQDKLYDSAQQRAEQYRTSHPAVPEAVLLLAKVQFAQSHFAETEGIILGFLQAHPEARAGRLLLIRMYLGTGRPQDAVPQLRKMIEQNPADVDSLMLLATIQQVANNLPEARGAYEKILALNATNPVALNNLAGLYLDLGELDKGLAAARKAREILPLNPNVADTLAWALYKQRQYSSALILGKEAAGKLTENADVHYHLGQIDYILGQENEARAALEKALRLDKKSPLAPEAERTLAILTLVAAADGPEQRNRLADALKERPEDPVLLYRLALAEERQGNYAPAAALLVRVLAVNAEHTDSLLALARIYAFQLKDVPKALDYAKAAQKIAPDEPRVLQLTGRIAYLSGAHPWAATLLRRAAAPPNVEPEVLFNLAEAELAVGQVEAAVTAMQAVVQQGKFFLRQDEARRFLELVRIAQKPGPDPAAAALVAQELQRDPKSLPALMAAGALAAVRGDAATVATNNEAILSLYPGFFPAKKALAAIYVWDSEKLDRAYELATQARTDLPDDTELPGIIGVLLYRRGEYPKATTQLLQAVRLQENEARFVFYLGMAQFKTGETYGARSSLEHALTMDGLPGYMATEARETLDAPAATALSEQTRRALTEATKK